VDPTDLANNRRGVLGPGQREQLQALSDSYGAVGHALGSAADTDRAFLAQLRRSLDDGRVLAATGEVGIDLPAFRAGTADRRIFDLPGNFESAYSALLDGKGIVKLAPWVHVLPGRYELYTIAPAGLVVGASPLPPLDHAQRFFGVLCSAQGLAADTLAQNRGGRMTEAQRVKLRSAVEGPIWIASLVLCALCAFSAAGRFLGILSSRTDGLAISLASIALALIFLVFGISSLVSRRRLLAATKLDLQEGRVTAFDGLLRKRISVIRQNTVSRQLDIGPRTFDITDRAELYAALIPGLVYRAYVAPRSGHLVAVELFDANATTRFQDPGRSHG
jgi:hypothetical protein